MDDKASKPKGNLAFETDPRKLEGRLVFSPDPQGPEWDAEKLRRFLREQEFQAAVEPQKLAEALDAFAGSQGEKASFTVVKGEPPEPSTDEALEWEDWEIPEELREVAQEFLADAPDPQVYDVRVEKVKVEEKVLKKPALPFLKAKEQTITRWKKEEIKNAVAVTNTPRAVGYFREGAKIASLEPARVGKPGRDIYGQPVPPEKPARVTLYLASGIKRRGSEIRVEGAGFARRGDDWIDLVPYKIHDLRLYTSKDGKMCLMDFSPGAGDRPTAAGVLRRAEELGFSAEQLMSAEEIDGLIHGAISDSRSLRRELLNRSRDGSFTFEVAPDRLRATLALHKAEGRGKPLSLKAVGETLVKSGLKRMDAARVRADILAFMKGPEKDLEGYVAAEGSPPGRGKDGEIRFEVTFLPPEETGRLLSRGKKGPEDEDVRLAHVEKGDGVAEVAAPTRGKPGVDVQGKSLPGLEGAAPKLELLGNLELQKGVVTAQRGGLLEVRRKEGITYARVRVHQEGQVSVHISDDRMQATISLAAPRGSGESVTADQVSAVMAEEGVTKGINSSLLLELTKRAQQGEDVGETLIAEGLPPRKGSGSRLRFHVPISSGRALYVAPAGERGKKDAAKKGALLAEILPPTIPSRDGWDVVGNPLSAPPAPGIDIKVGPNVRREEGEDGVVRLVAEKSGEVFYDGNLLDIKDTMTIQEDVTAEKGEINFSGSITVNGSVQTGGRVFAGGDVTVRGPVRAAVISSGGSITVRGAVEGTAPSQPQRTILRAKGEVRAASISDALVLAVGDVHAGSACLGCKVRCNGRLILDESRGTLVGGNVRAKQGVDTACLGSADGVRTEISFGQDYLVADQIEVEERAVDQLRRHIEALEERLAALESRPSAGSGLEEARREKLGSLRILEKRSRRLLNLREKFEEHFSSVIRVKGELYPGVIFESHGRIREVKEKKNALTVAFDVKTGRIGESAGHPAETA